jgi:hypothetical protein
MSRGENLPATALAHGQRLILYNAAPGSPSAEGLKLLSVVGTQWTADSVN